MARKQEAATMHEVLDAVKKLPKADTPANLVSALVHAQKMLDTYKSVLLERVLSKYED